ncbi:MAG: sulfatase-like hydrolase/transferase, partial [Chloroflexota bacterium]
MGQVSRRDFLKLLPLLPLMKVSWPHILPEERQLQQSPSGPNILVLVFDTLSASHMSLFGYDRQTTPNLARFAERATVFHRHQAAGNFTTPGTASI